MTDGTISSDLEVVVRRFGRQAEHTVIARKFADMQRENVYQTFKWTPRATRQVLLWGAIVPGTIAALAWRYDVSVV